MLITIVSWSILWKLPCSHINGAQFDGSPGRLRCESARDYVGLFVCALDEWGCMKWCKREGCIDVLVKTHQRLYLLTFFFIAVCLLDRFTVEYIVVWCFFCLQHGVFQNMAFIGWLGIGSSPDVADIHTTNHTIIKKKTRRSASWHRCPPPMKDWELDTLMCSIAMPMCAGCKLSFVHKFRKYLHEAGFEPTALCAMRFQYFSIYFQSICKSIL